MLQHRSYQKELLDRDDIPFEDIRRNMQELDFINQKLGGHDITLDGIVSLIKDQFIFNKKLSVVEIGCGGGDNLRAIRNWAERKRLPLQLSGIDINAHCIDYARQLKRNRGIRFIESDYKQIAFNTKPDIIFCSLFCHHFTDDELVFLLKWMRENTTIGFFINDLHRHWLAYYSIRTLTRLFSKSYLVRHDAPLSVKRGFKRKDWQKIFERAGITQYYCRWRWAFRWLITCSHAHRS